jgi:DNA-binding NarL/FixJ family response regulator
VRKHRPDVTLMDLRLPTMSGLTAIGTIRKEFPDARIVVLTTYEGEEEVFNALKAGAATYVLKDTLVEELVGIVREVHAGKHPLPAKVRQVLAERSRRPVLTNRESDVVKLIAEGRRDREIAELLGITEETVKTHVKGILTKFDAKNRSAAVTIAAIRGILRLS